MRVRELSWVLVVLLALGAQACGGGSPNDGGSGAGGGHRGGTLRGEATDGPDSLDPAQSVLIFSQNFIRMTNDGLTALAKADGEAGTKLVPDLATALPTPTDGGRTYVFHIRRGVRYSTGGTVKPSDFVSSFERIWKANGIDIYFKGAGVLEGSAACDAKPATCDLSKGMEADDQAYTLTFHLTKQDPDFLYRLANTFEVVLPPSTPLKTSATQPLPATGPYMVERYTPHQKLVLVRNPHFEQWSAEAQPAGYPDRIELTLGKPGEALVNDLERGTTDFMTNDTIPADRLNELGTRYADQIRVVPNPATYWIDLNVNVPPFSDPDVRRALNFAIDREAVVKLWGGSKTAAISCQVLPPRFPGHEDYCPYTANASSDGSGTWSGPDLARAQQLVAKSRYKGMDVRVWAENQDAERQVTLYVVGVLNKLGFHASMKTLSSSAYYGYISNSDHKVQADFNGWTATIPVPGNFLRTNFDCAAFAPHSPANYNIAEYCDKRFDALMDRADRLAITDREASNAVWAQAERMLIDAAPVAILFNPSNLLVHSARVKNPVYSNAGYPIWQLWQVE